MFYRCVFAKKNRVYLVNYIEKRPTKLNGTINIKLVKRNKTNNELIIFIHHFQNICKRIKPGSALAAQYDARKAQKQKSTCL